MKKMIIVVLAMAAVSAFAGDSVKVGSGIVRNLFVGRWTQTQVGVPSPTVAAGNTTTTTTVVTALPALLNKIVFTPGAVTDQIKVYDAASTSGLTDLSLVFSATFATPTYQINAPNIINFNNEALSFNSGIVVKVIRAATTTAAPAVLNWDITRNQ